MAHGPRRSSPQLPASVDNAGRLARLAVVTPPGSTSKIHRMRSEENTLDNDKSMTENLGHASDRMDIDRSSTIEIEVLVPAVEGLLS